MTKKTVNALIDMVNPIIDHPIKQNIEFTTEVDTAPTRMIETQIAAAFARHICHEVQVNNNPDYDWARGYVHKDQPTLIRTELIVIIP